MRILASLSRQAKGTSAHVVQGPSGSFSDVFADVADVDADFGAGPVYVGATEARL